MRDPAVKEALARFPTFGVNGELVSRAVKDSASGKDRVEYDSPLLVPIPRREQSIINSATPE